MSLWGDDHVVINWRGSCRRRWRTAGEYRRALATTEETVTLYRNLAHAEPIRHTPGLARSLRNLGVQFRRGDQVDEELRVRAEAVAWWARLARLRPDEHQEPTSGNARTWGSFHRTRPRPRRRDRCREHRVTPPALASEDDVPGDAEPRDFPTEDENDIR